MDLSLRYIIQSELFNALIVFFLYEEKKYERLISTTVEVTLVFLVMDIERDGQPIHSYHDISEKGILYKSTKKCIYARRLLMVVSIIYFSNLCVLKYF